MFRRTTTDPTTFSSLIQTSQQLNRRAFVRNSVIVGVLFSATGTLLAACGDNDETVTGPSTDANSEPTDEASDDIPEEDSSEDEPDVSTEEAHHGGRLNVGFSGSADSFDPHHAIQFDSLWINGMLYSRLLIVNSDMEIDPDLATDWDVSDDGLEWTFQLREDVVFHNGRSFSAEDVVESFNRLLDPEEATPHRSQIEMIEDVVADSETQITMHLSSPYGDLPLLLGMYYMRIIPIEEADTLATDPIGTGPYMLESHNPGERTVLVRFDDYFDTEEQAFLEEIHYITIGEETSRITALTGGTLHMINEISPTTVPMVENAPNLVMEEVITGSYQPLCMQVDQPPFDDVRVRQAFKLVLDRPEVVSAVIQGYGEAATDHPIPPIDPMYADLPIPEQNIERARGLLSEAGYHNGLEVELHTTSGRPNLMELALTAQEMAQAAGIEIEVRNHPVDNYWAEIWINRPFFIGNWSARPVADQALSVAYLEGAPWNETQWSNERFAELVMDARATTDEGERREMYREAQEILVEDGGLINPYFMSVIGCWHDNVHGYQMHPLRQVELHQVWIDE